jgi:mono/diheme cytochrome c family protein
MRSDALSRHLALAAASSALFAFAACSGESTVDPIPPGAVQYHAHVRPIFESRCVSCHQPGGIAPFSMSYDPAEWQTGAASWVPLALDSIEDGRMPPWLPAEGCRDLAFERRLGADELATLAEWERQGLTVGSPSTYPGPRVVEAPPALGEPTLAAQPDASYAPRADRADDYRCFVLPHEFTEETYLTASSVVPGDTAMVHHALLFLISPANLPTIEKLDAAEEGPGYTCFGGPGGGSLTTLGAWVPGSTTIPTAPGSAFVIQKGARIVLQMHYNTLALGGAAPPEERSTVRLWTSTTKPTHRIELLPLAHLGMEIPAGDPASLEERVFRMPTDATLVSLAPHMHLLGTEIRASLERESESDAGEVFAETCLINIPAWDFNWQQSYPLAKDARLPVKKGDRLRLRCTYDNSAANQPMVDGLKKMPTDVHWGEGTLDEMCLLFVGLEVPFETPDFRCGAFPECHATCPEGDARCFFDCATVGGGQCADCLIRAVGKCAPPYCAESGVALQKCTSSCEDDAPRCLGTVCAEAFESFYRCMEPHLANGDCDATLAGCGL